MQPLGADLVSMIKNQGRPELAHRRGAEPLGPRHFQYGFLVQVVAAEMLIGVEDHRIDLEERRDGAVRGPDRITRIDRV
jgi:hypothetical protein